MKPEADEPICMPERTLGKGRQVVVDEEVSGEYGLVINGHSLVTDKEMHYRCLPHRFNH